MAYSTGGGGNVQALSNAIRNFAVSLGWTDSGSGTNSRGGYQFLEKGICHIAYEWVTTDLYNYYPSTGASVVQLPNARIRAFAATGINANLKTYYGHPGWPNGSVEPGAWYDIAARTSNLSGTLAAWHLFSNANGDYIHCAVNPNADFWAHFSFGLIDKGDMSHGGAAYVTGNESFWARDNNGANADTGYSFNAPYRQNYPFNGTSQLYIPDALPVETGFTTIATPAWTNTTIVQGAFSPVNNPLGYPSNNYNSGRLLDHVAGASAPAWSGRTPMYGIPVIARRNDSGKYIAIGMYPNVRFINMTGLIPGQEITLGTETWKVFPVMRQEPWSSSGTLFVATTGQYGVAYKKI
jgi:hypothetical protein